MWFGTGLSGVSCYDGQNWKTYTAKDGLISNNIHAICQDNQGNMWFGTENMWFAPDGGRMSYLSCYDGQNWRIERIKDGQVLHKGVFAILQGKKP